MEELEKTFNVKNNNLNLARKWRPRNFQEIVGQDIPVKMLLNSLYLDKLFPVYLFAGQRGCGKTSSARVFAAAINCKNNDNFKSNPKEHKTPCLKCDSCKTMLNGSHPDFIEIDAASHTGVENVRQILESCAYLPILGRKKIYLIDEAHMLSKAAFNAFLKILEEPPASALFILATTERQKFPATVLSRCFQIIFKSINNQDLKKHLLNICKDENISIEEKALDILIQETEGSARDAINMLERVRFSDEKVTSNLILKVLGKVSETEILDLFEILIEKNPGKLLNTLNSKSFEEINPSILWNMVIQVSRAILWIKFEAGKIPSYFNDYERLKSIANNISINRLNSILQLFWSQESIFLRTNNKQTFLETVLLQICQQVNIADLSEILRDYKSNPAQAKDAHINNNTTTKSFRTKQSVNTKQPIQRTQEQPTPTLANTSILEPVKAQPQANNASSNSTWSNFLAKISTINNPFLSSIISQAEFVKFNEINKKVEIRLANNNAFTQSTIKDNEKNWKPILQEYYVGTIGFDFLEGQKKKIYEQLTRDTIPIDKQHNPIHSKPAYNQTPRQHFQQNPKEVDGIDLSDTKKWPKANLIQKYFPGNIKQENTVK